MPETDITHTFDFSALHLRCITRKRDSFLPEEIPNTGLKLQSLHILDRVRGWTFEGKKSQIHFGVTDRGFTAELMRISSGLMQKITTPASHHWVSLASWLACAPRRSRSHRRVCVYEATEKNPAVEEETCNFLSGCNYICFWVSVSYEHLIYELRLAGVSGASQTCSDITQRQRPDTNTLAPGSQTAWGTLDPSLRQWIRSDWYTSAVRHSGVNPIGWK